LGEYFYTYIHIQIQTLIKEYIQINKKEKEHLGLSKVISVLIKNI